MNKAFTRLPSSSPALEWNTSLLFPYAVSIKVATVDMSFPHWVNTVLCDKGFIEQGVPAGLREAGKQQ